MWCLTELLEGLYQTGRWPIGVYPGWLRYSMTYLVPIGFAITVPAEAVTSRLEWGTAVTALVFATARVHPLVLALRPAPLRGRLGLAGRVWKQSHTFDTKDTSLPGVALTTRF